jgi:hypothetical protein
MSEISAGTAAGTALVSTGDTTGALVLKTNTNTTALTLDVSGNATFPGNITVTGTITNSALSSSLGAQAFVLQVQPGDNGVPSLQSAPANFGII